MRLTGGVPDHGLAFGEHSGHDDVLGRHHARLVEEDRLAAQPRRAHLEAAVDLDLDAELGEPVDVRVEPASPDHVAARGRHGRAAKACEQRAREQERGADAAAQLLVELGLVDADGVDPDLVLAQPLGIGADVDQQVDHRLHVPDPRHVRELHRLGREHGGREDRKGAVLVPGGADGPAERAAALDHEGLHSGGERSSGHEAGYRRRPDGRNARHVPGRRSRPTRRANRCCDTRWPSRPRRGRTRVGSARTRSSGASSRCCTTSTTRSTPRSTSTLRTAPQSCARRAIRKR